MPYGENMWGKLHSGILVVIYTVMSQQSIFKTETHIKQGYALTGWWKYCDQGLAGV